MISFHFTEYKLSLLLLLFVKLSREYVNTFYFFFLCEYSRDRFVINVSREFCCVEISTNFLEVFTSVSIFHRIVEERKEKEKKSIYDLTTIIR